MTQREAVRRRRRRRVTPRAALASLRRSAARLDAATPPERDRTVDALRAAAIAGVILGHWLITALVVYDGHQLRTISALKYLPAFTPVSWIFQTLAVFFFVGGFTAARGLAAARRAGRGHPAWLRARLARLLRPVPVLIAVWIPLGGVLWAAGFSAATVRALAKLVVSPLWFLLVYGLLTALTPVAVLLRRRLGTLAPAVPLGVVAVIDLVRFAGDGPQWVGWLTVVAGWMVPFTLGVSWADGALTGRRAAAGLLVTGVAGTAGLVIWCGYPAAMVGIPGAAVSNLNPPTLAAVTLGVAQVGLALLLRDRLARVTRRPLVWAAVAVANLSAMTVFLWHQTALMCVTVLTLPLATLPGLHTFPSEPVWAAYRLLWIPVFAAMLAVLWRVFRRWERPGRAGRP